MIRLTQEPIDTNTVLTSVLDHAAGAAVLFVGTTREFTQGRQTTSLEYDCYPAMAKKELHELIDQAHARWPIVKASLVHRLGEVGLGEVSIAVAVSCQHRSDAFESAQWMMDRLKEVVPIWKKECWADGTTEWVHPGVDQDATPS